MTIAIEAKGLTKAYKKVKVLRGIDLSVPTGSIFALLGPNGAGKTTTVRILATLLKPDSGHAMVGGYDSQRDADKVHHVIGLTGQYAAVDELISGFENLYMIGRLSDLTKGDARERARQLLKRFDLVAASDRPVKDYSGGMRRRLDLAASLVVPPRILFLDEPTTGLDPRSRLVMWEVVRELTESGTTVLLTTQYLEEADQLADTIAVIDGGVIIAEGTPAELKRQVGSDRLELTFADKIAFDQAAKLMGEKALKNLETLTLTLEVDQDIVKITNVLQKLSDAKVKVKTFATHQPTLDDVFLRLTGRHAKKADHKEEN